MRHGRATVVAALAITVGLLAGGCHWRPDAAERVADASRVDMCTILTGAELSGLGVDLGSRNNYNRLDVVGCQWFGDRITLGLDRDESTVEDYLVRRDNPAFRSFRENEVNDREGVQFSAMRSGEDCVQLIDGGTVSLSVMVASAFGARQANLDPCAEALRIARMIEPRLP